VKSEDSATSGATIYRSCAKSENVSAAKGSWQLVALVSALVVVACVGAVLTLQETKPVAMEQEIGSFGTALNSRQNQDTEKVYENTFQDDPGHISRAELRFNAALRAAGGRDVGSATSDRMGVVSAPRLSSQWTAFPDPTEHKDKLTVNIEEKPVQKQAAPRHFGMTAKEARADLGGYFDSIDHQVKKQERKRAQQLLHALSLSQSPAHPASSSEVSPDTLAARKAHSLMKLVKKAESGKERSLIQLVQKAARSKVFQRALVGTEEGKYRRSLAGDF